MNKVLKERAKVKRRPVRNNTIPTVQDSSKTLIGSMDVKALCPSILKAMAARAARDAVNKTKLEWKNIDVTTLIRYVAVKIDREAIIKEHLDDVVPLPKGTTTLKSFANPRGKEAMRTFRASQFYPTKRLPSKSEVTKIIGLMIADCIDTCMDNHYYTIGGHIRKQTQGGSIGSDLTGESARIYMMM